MNWCDLIHELMGMLTKRPAQTIFGTQTCQTNSREREILQPSATINNHQQPPRPDQFLVIRQPLVDILTLRRFGQDRRTDGIDLGHDVQTFAHGCTLQFQDGENLLPRHPGGGDHIIIHQEVQLERDLLQSKNHPGAHTKWAVIVDMERWNALFQFFICRSTTPFARHDGNRVCRGGKWSLYSSLHRGW